MQSEWMKTRQTKYTLYVTVYLIVIVAILGAANWLGSRHNKSIDATSNKKFSLSDQTVKVVKGPRCCPIPGCCAPATAPAAVPTAVHAHRLLKREGSAREKQLQDEDDFAARRRRACCWRDSRYEDSAAGDNGSRSRTEGRGSVGLHRPDRGRSQV